MRNLTLVSAYLVLLLMLATLPDSAVASVAFGLVITAVVVTVVAVERRNSVLVAVFALAHGPSDAQRRLRGAFRRQQRPDEAGRPMPRAPGMPVGALG